MDPDKPPLLVRFLDWSFKTNISR